MTDGSRRPVTEGPPKVRVVLDTNVLVAFALLPEEVPRRRGAAVRLAVRWALENADVLASDATLAELENVLMRSGFARLRPDAERRAFIDRIRSAAVMVEPAAETPHCADPGDLPFLAAAMGGSADWLVTSDRQVLSVRQAGTARIVRPERFVEWVVEGGAAAPAHGGGQP